MIRANSAVMATSLTIGHFHLNLSFAPLPFVVLLSSIFCFFTPRSLFLLALLQSVSRIVLEDVLVALVIVFIITVVIVIFMLFWRWAHK